MVPAVGSDENVAAPMTVLNLIVADQLTQFAKEVDREIENGTEKRIAIVNILRKYIKASKKIRFEGDNYSVDWITEADKRGLSNIKDTPRALDSYLKKESVSLYKRHNILSLDELEARNEIRLEDYIMKVQIDSRIMGEIALSQIIPASINYQNKLIENARGQKELGIDIKYLKDAIERISYHINIVSVEVNKMIDERREINKIENTRDRAIAYCDRIKEKYFDKIRNSGDQLELLVDDEYWPLVKYRELLFIR